MFDDVGDLNTKNNIIKAVIVNTPIKILIKTINLDENVLDLFGYSCFYKISKLSMIIKFYK